MKEFIDCGPRLVRVDALGPYLRYKGDIVRSPLLDAYIGQKVHVTASLVGNEWSIAEWRDRAYKHPGGWRARYGESITVVKGTGRGCLVPR